MSDFLCLRFKDINLQSDCEVFWSVLSGAGQISSSGCARLKELPLCVPNNMQPRKTVLIAPTEALLLTEVNVPKAQQRHLNQVLAFVAEEQIIEPIESMHLAMPMFLTGDDIPLAVVKKSLLASWLNELESHGFVADFLFPDSLCVPDTVGDHQIFFDTSRVLFRYSQTAGLSVDEPLALSMLDIKLASLGQEKSISPNADRDLTASSNLFPFALLSAGDEPPLTDNSVENERASSDDNDDSHDEQDASDTQKIEHVSTNVVLTNELKASLKSALAVAQIEYKEVQYSESMSELLSIKAIRTIDQGLNILQGEFRPKSANADSRRIIRKASMIMSTVLGIFMLLTLGGGSYLNYQADQYYADSVGIYRALFPQQRRVIDPVKQLRRQLRGQVVGVTTSEFLPLLDAASDAMSSLELDSASVISQLRYDAQRGQIVIDIRAENIDVLEAYKEKMVERGLNVDILSANQSQGMISGKIQISQT